MDIYTSNIIRVKNSQFILSKKTEGVATENEQITAEGYGIKTILSIKNPISEILNTKSFNKIQ